MATWNSRGLRGSTLEEFINRTNEKYLENGLALIQKVPTPITPINIDKATRHITLAYFDQKSTVDYIGAVQGIPVCFDAKECNTDTFPLQNIHEHQVVFMENFEKQMGIASGGADTGKLPCHERRFPGGGARLRLRPAGDTELSERCVSGTDHDQGRPEDHRPE